jgi:luciferase family oxidoreductase group 1
MKTLATTALSILDLAKVSDERSIKDTFSNSKSLAQHAEKLGYTRFWLAEHHNIEGIASAATSILIGYIAENTKSIRVGSGGIMLPNHSPLIVAEQFGTLESLYPGRIDLGLGRAPGTDQSTMRAIRRGLQEVDFGDLIDELLFYFSPAQTGQKVRAIPGAGMKIPLYILGSSLYSAKLAARLGRPYAFAGHFAPAQMMHAFDIYRSAFQPSDVLKKPYVIAGVPVVAAKTDEKAAFLATSIQQAFLGIIRGNRKLSSPPVSDMNAIWSQAEKETVESMLGLLITGSPKTIHRELNAFIAETQVDELMITSDTYDQEDRMRSYEFIAESKNL